MGDPRLRPRALGGVAAVMVLAVGAALNGCETAAAGRSTELSAAQATQATVAPSPTPVPTVSPTPAPPPAPSSPRGTCAQTRRQRQVEQDITKLSGYGLVIVDGKQSVADCKAIKRFQRRFEISPADGRADATTADLARRLALTDPAKCKAKGRGTTTCVDLTHQTAYVIRNGKVVLGPTVTRTGMPGFATPAGTFHILNRNISEWSKPYKVWLPYWQRFFEGMGFHETTTYIHEYAVGSHGCVNLLHADVTKLWDLIGLGSTVHIYGHRAGT